MQSGSSQPIEVAVEVQYLQQESAPDAERYVFAYTITISNLGSVPSQLLNRHWIITITLLSRT